MGLDGFFSVFEGYVMIIIYVLYLLDLTRQEQLVSKIKGRKPEMHLAIDASSLVGGLLLVVFASNYVISNGLAVAEVFGLTQTFVGIFIIGLGTGLPELAVSLTALKKKEVQMSVGNLIGSNICDLLLSFGAGTIIAGFLVPRTVLLFDLPALLIISLTAIYLFRTGFKLAKKEGIILILMYAAYLGIRLAVFG